MNQVPTKGRVTNEELTLIRDYIMFPHMLTMSEKSLVEVKATPNLYKSYFEKFALIMMNRITKELAKVRKEFKDREIKVFDEETNDGIIYHTYTCRGYKDRFGIVRETLRSEISVRLAKYAENVFKGV